MIPQRRLPISVASNMGFLITDVAQKAHLQRTVIATPSDAMYTIVSTEHLFLREMPTLHLLWLDISTQDTGAQ